MRRPAARRWRSAARRIEVLTAARTASEWTAGKFDITFGALADIWKFDHDQDNTVPDAAAINARLPLVDHQAVQVDAAKGTAFISRPGVRVHLGGIGKGYARGSRRHDVEARRFPRLPDPGRRRHVRGGHEQRHALDARHRRSAWRARRLRGGRSPRCDVLHVGRLRAVLHEGRRALSPPDRSRSRRTGARLPQRDHRRRPRGDRRRAVDRRLHHGPGRRHGAGREACPTSRR